MRAVIDVLLAVLEIYQWVMIAMIILSWLIAFRVVNTRNQFVDAVWRALLGLTEPVLRPIRRALPRFSGIDVSPIIVFLLIYFIKLVIYYYIRPNVF